ncbi:hypothetical protein DS487_16865 [Salmonella enterica subsp. enterica]|nr:hypothetical protein [Salmonella enterica subsp. enterica serovar Hvittingfoss]
MNAQARGARAAKWYKKAKSRLIIFDQRCVQKARSYHLPAWAGHLPIAALSGILIAAIFLGSLFIVGLSLLVFALTLLLSVCPSKLPLEENDSPIKFAEEEDGYHSGFQGTGYYMGGYRIDRDE